MDTKTRNLVQSINGLRSTIALSQAILTEYLVPDGITKEEAINRLLGLLDGPALREVEAFTEGAILEAERKPAFATDLVVEPVDFSFVWTKKGHLPRVAHHREDAALAEAERLARKNPGTKFIVLRAVHKLHIPSKLKETNDE
jgi:hypothetical protein